MVNLVFSLSFALHANDDDDDDDDKPAFSEVPII